MICLNKQEAISLYEQLSQKNNVSALDLARGIKSRSSSEDGIICLTLEDTEYLASLDVEELSLLKRQIMAQWGLKSDEEIQKILDHTYDIVCDQMDCNELIQFNDFIDIYLDMPAGTSTLRQFDAFKIDNSSIVHKESFAGAAVCVDKFGRNAYKIVKPEPLSPMHLTKADCLKYFRNRIILTCVSTTASCIYEWFIPGGLALVAVCATCEAIDAYMVYKNCMKHAYSKNSMI